MKKAFTLIELMVVVSVIGFLSAIAISRYSDVTQSARVANVQGNLANLRTSIEMFNAKNDRYPSYLLISRKSNGDSGDISSKGDLSDEFVKYYSKSIMPVTPGSDSISPTNSVVATRDDSGGWLYQEDGGYIFANLKNGNYTGDEDGEVWNEEEVSDPGDGENPGDGNTINGEDLKDFIGSSSGQGKDIVYDENKEALEVTGKSGKGRLKFNNENCEIDEVSEVSIVTNSPLKEEDGWILTGMDENKNYIYTLSFDETKSAEEGFEVVVPFDKKIEDNHLIYEISYK